ncbi:PLP-dependent aminotransferase family protein, partial [Streptomyces sp. NPDC002764]
AEPAPGLPSALLVRPDGYIAWASGQEGPGAWASGADGPAAALRALFGPRAAAQAAGVLAGAVS